MKYISKTYLSLIFLSGLTVFIACNKNSNSAIAPGYAYELSGGNSNNNNQPSPNASINNISTNIPNVGTGISWTSWGCQPGLTCLTTVNTSLNTTVTVCFSSLPVTGVYQLVSSNSMLAPGKAVLTVTNPQGQIPGSIWYSASGTTSVFNSSTSITASFTNITCLDSPGSLDSVTVSGQVGCL